MEQIPADGTTPNFLGFGSIVCTSPGVQPKPIRGPLAADSNVRIEKFHVAAVSGFTRRTVSSAVCPEKSTSANCPERGAAACSSYAAIEKR
jgi:hypothetical protein